MLQTTVYVDVWDSPADEGVTDFHLIDSFTIAVSETVSNCVDESNSLTVQGELGIVNLTLVFFNLTSDPITSCSSADVSTFSTSSPTPTSKIHVANWTEAVFNEVTAMTYFNMHEHISH